MTLVGNPDAGLAEYLDATFVFFKPKFYILHKEDTGMRRIFGNRSDSCENSFVKEENDGGKLRVEKSRASCLMTWHLRG
jgi:hypothetical protein